VRGYNYRWRNEYGTGAADAHLREHPLCVECEKEGLVVPATCVDHIVPHKGDERLFWDYTNFQSLCSSCHSRKTTMEDGGFGNERK
jgi:5-methylcytosine-specific restriction protein A